MRRLLLATLAVTALACAACGGGGTDAAGNGGGLTTVNVAHVASPLFSPLYVADAKGYFKDQGVKVKLDAVASGQDAVPLASSGQIDAIVAGFSAGFFSALDSGLKLRVVGSMAVGDGGTQDPPAALEAATSLVDKGTVRTAKDLKGRKVAVAGGPGGSGAYLLDLLLRQQGLSIKDVSLSSISNSDMPAALKGGSVDATMTSAPFSKAIETAGTGKPIGVSPAGSSSTGVIYSEKFAKSKAGQGFFDALVRASHDLQGDARRLPENVAPVAAAMKVDPSVLAGLPLFAWRPDLAPLQDQLDAMQRTWLEAGQLKYKDPKPAADYTDFDISKKAEAAVK